MIAQKLPKDTAVEVIKGLPDKEIDHVVFNDPATIVFWKDGTKTVTKCHAGDTFNKETGLAMCIIRKLTKNKHYNNVFEKYCH